MSSGSNKRFLIEASCAKSTLSKYRRAVELFVVWCDENGRDAVNYEELDDAMADYFHDMYEQNDGSGKGLAAQTFYGLLKLMPRATDNLPTAYASLQGWLKLQPSQSYPPMTWELAVLVAVHLTRNGKLRYAIATLLAFDCFLRVGELVSLRKCDVADSGDSRLGRMYQGLALRLRQTKTGPNQWVEVHDSDVMQLVRMVLECTSSDGDSLFPFTANQFRLTFKQACTDLGLHAGYVPHSLRHGGATRWHLDGKPLEDILMRGRWASTKSARRYVQAGRALLLTTSVPQSLAELGRTLASDVIRSIQLSLPQ